MSTVNRVYPSGRAAILSGAVDLVSDVLSVQLVDETFVYNATHDRLDDIPSGQRLGGLTAVAGTRSVSGATIVTDDDSTTIPAVPAGPDEVAGVLLVGPGASDADRTLICVWMRGADRTPIVATPDGGSIVVEFVDGVILSLGG